MYARRRSEDEIQKMDTVVWSCTNEDCKVWIRDDYSFEDTPTCTLCGSSMQRSSKLLPVLMNNSQDWKLPKNTSRPKA
ncbi:cold-shock protein [Xylanibacillus composti]|uniref:Cold-inducible protein YdjO n=3 Tax=Xylanibacillus composti TaxID=1572762 RepID=A0A8J4M0X4_9BACL|nr:cold-shock protein [Xylanibacillus composti]GIQ67520.1 hypothetical protein XYCOK13_03440 [Xylanibacillus composti]